MIRLSELAPDLRRLRDRLYARIVDCDDLPAEYVRRLYGWSADVPIWSRTDALRNPPRRGDRARRYR